MKIIIDDNRLQRDLEDYYGSAMFSGFPMALMDLSRMEYASGDELAVLANECGFDLARYMVGKLEG